MSGSISPEDFKQFSPNFSRWQRAVRDVQGEWTQTKTREIARNATDSKISSVSAIALAEKTLLSQREAFITKLIDKALGDSAPARTKAAAVEHFKAKLSQKESFSDNLHAMDFLLGEILHASRTAAEVKAAPKPAEISKYARTKAATPTPPKEPAKIPKLILNPIESSEQERRIPRLRRGQTAKQYVEDREIVDKLPIIAHGNTAALQPKEELASQLNQPVPVYFTEKGTAILHQLGPKGGAAAAVGMLILDHEGTISVRDLRMRRKTSSDHDIIHADLERAGLKPITSTATSPEELKALIDKNGSAIITIRDPENDLGREVIIDKIGPKGVRMRDPYHGWEITISHDAFNRLFKQTAVTQVP